MADAATVTAVDVATELVATKLALADLIDTLTGTSPSDVSTALSDWANESPVQLPMSETYPDQYEYAFSVKLMRRSAEIQAEILGAVARCFAAQAASERDYAATGFDELEADG